MINSLPRNVIELHPSDLRQMVENGYGNFDVPRTGKPANFREWVLVAQDADSTYSLRVETTAIEIKSRDRSRFDGYTQQERSFGAKDMRFAGKATGEFVRLSPMFCSYVSVKPVGELIRRIKANQGQRAA